MRHFFTFICFVTFIHSHSCAEEYSRGKGCNMERCWYYGTPQYLDYDWELQVIKRAMKDIQSVSCIRFKRRSRETAYLKILKGNKCQSWIGYTGRPQEMTLATKCFSKTAVLHELFHALGFHHEQTRPDRDDYVRVIWNNIKPGAELNFIKMSFYDVTTLGLPYDYYSIMHYQDRMAADDESRPTLVSKYYNTQNMGQVVEMSKLDILKLNRLYRCPMYRR